MSTCPLCQGFVLVGAAVCPHCHAEFVEPELEPMSIPVPPRAAKGGRGVACRNCGADNPVDNCFCDRCGLWIGSGCPGCGIAPRPGAAYCGRCGRALPVDAAAVEIADYAADKPPDRDAIEERPQIFAEVPGGLSEFHRRAVREYAALWFDPARRAELEVTAGDAAYHLLQHAALLGRLTGNPSAVGGLFQLAEPDRDKLVEATAGYLRGLALVPTAAAILKAEALEPEDLEQLEDLLLTRDGLEEVLRVAAELSRGLTDPAMYRPALAAAAASAAEFDDLLHEREDVLSVLGHTLRGTTREMQSPIDATRSWWFSRPGELDREADAGTLLDLVPPALVSKAVVPPVPVPKVTAAATAPSTAYSTPLSTMRGTPLLPAPERDFVLSADTATRGSGSVYLWCPANPAFGGLLLALEPGKYQFLALDPQRHGTDALDGAELIVRAGDTELTRARITAGSALFNSGDAQTCAVITSDGVEWELMPES